MTATVERVQVAGPPDVRPTPVRDALFVFIVFFVLTVLLYGLPVLTRLGSACVGACVRDLKLYVWSFDWFRHAVVSGLDPFHTSLLWAPDGTPLTWVTTLPAPATAILPVTAIFGPVAAANLLLLLAPSLAGWAMYLVCRRITHRLLPAVFGAAVFALSTYVGQLMRAQLNLLLMFWVPLGLYLFLRYLDRSLSLRRFVVLFALVLVGGFLTSTEVFAMATFCGGVAFAVYWVWGSRELRSRLEDGLKALAIGYAAAVLILSPLLIRTLGDTPDVVLRPTAPNSADLVGFAVPGVSTWAGGDTFTPITDRLLDQDNFAYIGLPLLAVVAVFAAGASRRKGTWPLVGLFVGMAVLSMGPRLYVLGEGTAWLPGWVVSQLPLLQHAVPVRYILYAWFALAVIVAIWLAEPARRSWVKYTAVAIGVVLILPSQRSARDTEPVYHQMLVTPSFFSDGQLEQHVAPDDVVLAVPEHVGDELLWQVESGMRFRLANAYIGPSKPKNGLGNLSLEEPPPAFEDFTGQLSASRVDVVIASWPMPLGWEAFLETSTGTVPEVLDDVALYRVSSAVPVPD